MEAGTGIEPVFTDLQSNSLFPENNPVSRKKYHDKSGTPDERDTPAHKPKSILSQYMQDRHKRAAKALGYALVLADQQAWANTAIIWEARLEPAERYELARSVMLAMRPEDTEALFADVMGGAGSPLPIFLAPMADARSWASWASRSELKAYALACFEAMTPKDRAGFYNHISTVEVAA